jgi:hypothetical protein
MRALWCFLVATAIPAFAGCSGKPSTTTPSSTGGASGTMGYAGGRAGGTGGTTAAQAGNGALAGSGGAMNGAGGKGGAPGGQATSGAAGRANAEGGKAGARRVAGSPSAGAGGTANDAGSAGEGVEAGAGGGYWQPKAGLTWQWQQSESVGAVLDVSVYDIDWESDAGTVATLHAAGKKVICYVSVGSWEDFRPDAGDFPDAVVGNDYDGWPGEKYLDIRSDTVRALMLTRFEQCRTKGFDAIEPDNMDVFELGADSGFPLTRADGIDYAKWLASAAHERGMGIGQKNTSSLTATLEPLYDWALTESCYSDGNWCGDVLPYVSADKPVFECEYEAASFSDACKAEKDRGYSPILKTMALDATITFCP